MSQKTRLLIAAIPAALVLVWLLAFGIDRMATSGEVARGVTAAGIDLSGLSEEDATAAVVAYESTLLQPAEFVVKEKSFQLDPRRVGVGVNEQAIVAEAMAVGADEGFFSAWFGWFGSFGNEVEIEVPVSVNEDDIRDVLEEWENEAIANPAFEGDIVIRDGRALPEYPRPGEGIDTDVAVPTVERAVVSTERTPTPVLTRRLDPELTKEDLDAAVVEANARISKTVTLTASDPEVEVVLEASALAGAYDAEVVTNSPTTIEQGFDRAEIAALLEPYSAAIEQPPRNARFRVNADNTVALLPGRPETLIDVDMVIEALEAAALTNDGLGEFPFAYGEEPNFTTEEAEAMGPITLEGSFTTEHPSGQPRVTNIHKIADAVDGAVVWPGQEFSLNDHVGQRTEAKGYVPAPMILRGELVDDVGGGVSQFATTFYNASFYGCYQAVTHKPHSFYFSRYPEVNEATISWPAPDLVVRNNTDAVLIIKTAYSSTSITVKFFGNNGGKKCERRLGDRFDITEPPIKYEANASVNPGSERVTSNGSSGFTNSVVRVITNADGSVDEERWSWKYQPQARVIEVHPCDMPGSNEPCPIVVPNVVGLSQGDAVATLQGLGFVVAIGNAVETSDAGLDGRVASQSSMDYLPVGSTVTIDIYTYVAPPEPPPEPPPEDPPPEDSPDE